MNVLRIEEHIGRRIRRRRRLLGLTLTALGQACGTTFQQIQKYEAGQSSMYATRLWQIARALDAPVLYFFEGLPGYAARAEGGEPDRWSADVTDFVRAFASLEAVRRRGLLELALALARANSGEKTRRPGAVRAEESHDRAHA